MGSKPTWVDLLPAPTPDMSKRSVFTSITPLPAHVSRETAVRLLHDHTTMIQMNPLVIRMEPTTPPPNATPEETKVMHWYAITDEIVYVPGTKVKGETTYKAGFYDLPLGLQTHVFAPAGVDIKTKWSVGGSLPGEQKESVELGLNAPRDGLYIQEDANLRCSVFVMNFVKRNLKRGHMVLCEKLIEKASQADEERKGKLNRESFMSSDADSILQRWDHLYTPNSKQGSSSTTNGQSPPVDNTCACEGVSHEPSCSFYMHPGPAKRFSRAESHKAPASASRPTMDMLLGQRQEYERPQQSLSAYAQYSPAGAHPCGCNGGVHSQGCPQYPGLVLLSRPRSSGPDVQASHENQQQRSQQQTYQLTLPTSADSDPQSAYARSNPYSFSKPQSPAANVLTGFSGHTFRPQRPGEQAELPATTEWETADDVYSAVELKPDPLWIRTQHGHAMVMELDGEQEMARQYWQQRVGNMGGVARG